MATADELLSILDNDKILVIDKDLRTITIPASVKSLGVQSDDDVLRLRFKMPRMYDDIDLSTFSIRINYMNAAGVGDVYIVDDATFDESTITFTWLIGRTAAAAQGSVRFIVCMKLLKNIGNEKVEVVKEYNTTVASLPILEGLETSEAVVQQNPDVLEYILTNLNSTTVSDDHINELIDIKLGLVENTYY